MSYGNYGRYSYSPYSGRTSSYFPSGRSSSRTGRLTPSYSSSYLAPSSSLSSPRQTSSGGAYKLVTSRSTSSIHPEEPLYEVRSRYGSSTSIPDSASDVSSKSDSSRVSEDEIREYKKLYEDVKKENEDVKKENASLKEQLKKTEEELETAKKQLQKLSQGNIMKSSISEAEKKERRSLERKLSEMEEELKQIDKLKADNDRMKEDNAALIRVISKISQ